MAKERVPLIVAGVISSAVWVWFLIDLILTLKYGWEGRDQAFGVVPMLMFGLAYHLGKEVSNEVQC